MAVKLEGNGDHSWKTRVGQKTADTSALSILRGVGQLNYNLEHVCVSSSEAPEEFEYWKVKLLIQIPALVELVFEGHERVRDIYIYTLVAALLTWLYVLH